jgi:hypothetical protein
MRKVSISQVDGAATVYVEVPQYITYEYQDSTLQQLSSGLVTPS